MREDILQLVAYSSLALTNSVGFIKNLFFKRVSPEGFSTPVSVDDRNAFPVGFPYEIQRFIDPIRFTLLF